VSSRISVQRPIPLHQVVPLILTLKFIVFRIIESDPAALQENKHVEDQAYALFRFCLGFVEGISVTGRNVTCRQSTIKSITFVLSDLHSRW
jgi:hypothetical protein